MNDKKLILGIETSCDDTSAALLEIENNKTTVLAHLKYGQEEVLKNWGGVVPEIAARNHLEKITPVLKEVFELAQRPVENLDLISVTTTPGLLGPLLTGVNAAKSLSLLHKVPILPANHLFAHLEAIHLTETIQYPYLGLLVSGGHSIYFWVENSKNFKILGSTIDDAAGEAFDKGGKILELGYPAGHIIDQLAQFGNENKYDFPIGLQSSADARLSFSGLKTALKLFVGKKPDILAKRPTQFKIREDGSQEFYDLCASYQNAITKALLLKLRYAINKAKEIHDAKNFPIIVGGGVACNSHLRKKLKEKYKNSFFVKSEYCTDNGAMIANYGRLHLADAIQFPYSLSIDARGRFIDKKEIN